MKKPQSKIQKRSFKNKINQENVSSLVWSEFSENTGENHFVIFLILVPSREKEGFHELFLASLYFSALLARYFSNSFSMKRELWWLTHK